MANSKKKTLKQIELKDNHTLIILSYKDSIKALTKSDIIRLLDLETNLYLTTLQNTSKNEQNKPTFDFNNEVRSRSWNSISRKIEWLAALGEKVATKEVLDDLLTYLKQYDWKLNKRMNRQALVELNTILNTWNIDSYFKTEFSNFIQEFKHLENKLYKNRKRRVDLGY